MAGASRSSALLPPPQHPTPPSHPTPCAGHYADAGEAAVLMASTLDVHMVMTGHSLGRNKLEHLLASGGWVDEWVGGGPWRRAG